MKKYNVTIQRFYDYEFEVEADDELEAEEKAEELFDELEIKGQEMWSNYNNRIEEVEELKDSDIK